MKKPSAILSIKVPTSAAFGIILLISASWGVFLFAKAFTWLRYSNYVLPVEKIRKWEEAKVEWPLLEDDFLFLETHIRKTGEVLEGRDCPLLMIDFPTYTFYPEDRVLGGVVNFDVNKNLKIVYGRGQSLGGAAGGGAATSLKGIYEVPWSRKEIVFRRVDGEGKVWLRYRGEEVVVAPGESWEEEEEKVVMEGECKKRIKTTRTVKNYGVLAKDNIEPW